MFVFRANFTRKSILKPFMLLAIRLNTSVSLRAFWFRVTFEHDYVRDVKNTLLMFAYGRRKQ